MKLERFILVEKELEAITFIVSNLWDVLKVENDSNKRIVITFDTCDYPFDESMLPDYFKNNPERNGDDLYWQYQTLNSIPTELFKFSTIDFTTTFSNANGYSIDYGKC